MKISVCVPVYGVEKYIERCARSLFEQTLQDDVEFIFVNDCTKDNSIEILRKVLLEYPHRREQVRIIEHPCNKGLSAARNTALANAAGEYITHVDSDDFLKPNALEKLLETAQKTDADFVTAGVCMQYDDHEEFLPVPAYENKADYLSDMLSRKILCNIWNNLIRKKLYTQHNITVPETLNMGEDLAVTPRLVHFAEKVAFCPEVLYCYYRSNTTSYCNTFKLKNLQDVMQAHNLLHDFFTTADPPASAEILRAMRVGNFLVQLAMSVFNLEHLKWLKKNFPCRVWYLGNGWHPGLKIINVLFQLGLLRCIVLCMKLYQQLHSKKKQ